MNLELLEGAFEQRFPEVIEDTLEEGYAVKLAFNRRGSLLASGCNDGRVIVWDFDTRAIARILCGHVHPVSSVSWSRDSRRLLTASTDCAVILWDVVSATKVKTFQFSSPILLAQLHPRDFDCFLVVCMVKVPLLVNITSGEQRSLGAKEMGGTADSSSEVGELAATVENGDIGRSCTTTAATTDKPDQIVAASFNRRGGRIYTGSMRGMLYTYNSVTLECESSFQATSQSAPIKNINVSRKGHLLAVNCADRTLRIYDSKTLQLKHKFQDLVNRTQWKRATFSNDAEYVIAGSALKAQHDLYIWDSVAGSLVKILEGPKEGLLDLVWHPVRPIIGSCSTFGVVYIWAVNYQENWSAFAPDFKELEENVEYIEREDEFDIPTEASKSASKGEKPEEDVDVTTVDPIAAFMSSDEEDGDIPDELTFLPALLDGPREPTSQQQTATNGSRNSLTAVKKSADNTPRNESALRTTASAEFAGTAPSIIDNNERPVKRARIEADNMNEVVVERL